MIVILVNIDGRVYRPYLAPPLAETCSNCIFEKEGRRCSGRVLGMSCWDTEGHDWVGLLGGKSYTDIISWEEVHGT